jgi:glutathione S-transferase
MSQFANEKITLKYWNGRGLMEVPRQLLAIAGKFPGDYTDGRFEAPAEGLDANLGRMPVIDVGSNSIGQSAAINFFIASENGLMGSNNLEAAQIISIQEHIKEMLTAYRTVTPYGSEPTPEQMDTWFNQGSTDLTGNAERAGYSTRYLKWWMGRMENVMGTKGYAVGDKLSLADVLLYNAFGEHLKDSEAAEGVTASRRGAFGSKERTDAALANHPRIKASVDAVANNANIQKWLSIRGVQGF